MQLMKKKMKPNDFEISKNKTITNINQAQTNNQVDNAKDNGMNEIATIIPATTIKTDAKRLLIKS